MGRMDQGQGHGQDGAWGVPRPTPHFAEETKPAACCCQRLLSCVARETASASGSPLSESFSCTASSSPITPQPNPGPPPLSSVLGTLELTLRSPFGKS